MKIKDILEGGGYGMPSPNDPNYQQFLQHAAKGDLLNREASGGKHIENPYKGDLYLTPKSQGKGPKTMTTVSNTDSFNKEIDSNYSAADKLAGNDLTAWKQAGQARTKLKPSQEIDVKKELEEGKLTEMRMTDIIRTVLDIVDQAEAPAEEPVVAIAVEPTVDQETMDMQKLAGILGSGESDCGCGGDAEYANEPKAVVAPLEAAFPAGDDVHKAKNPADIRTDAPSMYPDWQAKQ
jgi:hypothetical protein